MAYLDAEMGDVMNSLSQRKMHGQWPDMRSFEYMIDANNGELDEETYTLIKSQTRIVHDRMFASYAEYCDAKEFVDIYSRRPRFAGDKALEPLNNKIHLPILADIVELSTGYFAGNAFTYGYNTGIADPSDTEVIADKERSDVLTDFTVRNTISDVDMETTRYCTVCGAAGRLLTVDNTDEALEIVRCIPPWQITPIGEDAVDPKYAIYEYPGLDSRGQAVTYMEFFGPVYMQRFIVSNGKMKEVAITGEQKKIPHKFKGCPASYVIRNEQMSGDADEVRSILHAIDKLVSDWMNDLEGFANAYMYITGAEITEEVFQQIQQTGMINVASGDGEGTPIQLGFLTKTIDAAGLKQYFDLLSQGAYKYSQTPDLGDAEFSGNSSGVALKYKLFGLNAKSDTFERKYMRAYQRMARLLSAGWNERARTTEKFDPTKFTLQMKRSFPLDLQNEADATVKLAGMVSEETRLSILSFVADAQAEMAKMQQEKIASLAEDYTEADMQELYQSALLDTSEQTGGSYGADQSTQSGTIEQASRTVAEPTSATATVSNVSTGDTGN